MKVCYTPKKFTASSQEKIETANEIIDEYQAQGFQLTLRQIYYQFVARGLLPNTQKDYKNLGSVINDGRLAGQIDWEAIQDRTRFVRSLTHWESPSEIVNACVDGYRLDRWENQGVRLEVWIEKDDLIGVIEKICEKYDVPYFSCRGYVSQSEMWRASQRIVRRHERTVILHLGDHDPSGVDMTRDIRDRLHLFVGGADSFEVDRIALNMNQINQYNPPPNPAKITDSRASSYIKNFGNNSWELDALEPSVMVSLLEHQFKEYIDSLRWQSTKRKENNDKNILSEIAEGLDL